MKQQRLERRENRTLSDIGDLAYAVMLLAPTLAIAAYGLSRMLGLRAALWLGIGFGLFVVSVFAFIVVMCVAGSYAYALVAYLKRRHERSRNWS